MIITKKPLVISFPSIVELTYSFVRFTEEFCRDLGFEQQVIDNVVLSVDEALANAIKHGNRYNPEIYVRLEFDAQPDGLTIRITDQGSGFSLDEVQDPLKDENLLKKGGRGVFLMHSLIEKVDYIPLNPGMCVQLYISYQFKPRSL